MSVLQKGIIVICLCALCSCQTYVPGTIINDYNDRIQEDRIFKDYAVYLKQDGYVKTMSSPQKSEGEIYITSVSPNQKMDEVGENQIKINSAFVFLSIITVGILPVLSLPVFPWTFNEQTIVLQSFYNDHVFMSNATESTYYLTANGYAKARDMATVSALRPLLEEMDYTIYHQKDVKNYLRSFLDKEDLDAIAETFVSEMLKATKLKEPAFIISTSGKDRLTKDFRNSFNKALLKTDSKIVNFKESMIKETRDLRQSDEIHQSYTPKLGELIYPEFTATIEMFFDKDLNTYVDLSVTRLSTGVLIWEDVKKLPVCKLCMHFSKGIEDFPRESDFENQEEEYNSTPIELNSIERHKVYTNVSERYQGNFTEELSYGEDMQ